MSSLVHVVRETQTSARAASDIELGYAYPATGNYQLALMLLKDRRKIFLIDRHSSRDADAVNPGHYIGCFLLPTEFDEGINAWKCWRVFGVLPNGNLPFLVTDTLRRFFEYCTEGAYSTTNDSNKNIGFISFDEYQRFIQQNSLNPSLGYNAELSTMETHSADTSIFFDNAQLVNDDPTLAVYQISANTTLDIPLVDLQKWFSLRPLPDYCTASLQLRCVENTARVRATLKLTFNKKKHDIPSPQESVLVFDTLDGRQYSLIREQLSTLVHQFNDRVIELLDQSTKN